MGVIFMFLVNEMEVRKKLLKSDSIILFVEILFVFSKLIMLN